MSAHGSIIAAAETLNVTTSAVSQQLAKLESETGQTLLERHGRGVRLTDAAAALQQLQEQYSTGNATATREAASGKACSAALRKADASGAWAMMRMLFLFFISICLGLSPLGMS